MPTADKVKILIVDDLPEKLLVLGTILEELGQDVVTACSGEEALRQVLERDFAVILLDVNMPGLDGFETASYIRRRKKSALTPIIFITAFADEMHTAQGYSLGAVDYILSPVMPEVLRSKVKVFVDLFDMAQQVRRQADERVALAREQSARVAAEEATRRSNFLAEASTVLSSSLDSATTQRGLLQLVVPSLADLASVTLLSNGGPSWHSNLAWVMPEEGATIHYSSMASADAPVDELRTTVEEVLASGKAKSLPKATIVYPPPGSTAKTAGSTQIAAAAVFPLLARGQILGALTLAHGRSGPQSHTDNTLAQDLASRAAIALDNARLYHELQESDRRKNDFLSMLAHELRNPLAPIRNAVQIQRSPRAQEKDRELARDVIDRQVTHMARLIDDLLDIARLSRGKILLRKEPLDLAALLQDVVEDYRRILESEGLDVRLDLCPEPVCIEADRTRVAQIIGNVLHNASKFTDRGGQVSVLLSVAGDVVEIRVRDSGIGMSPVMLDRLFEPFYQAEIGLDRSRGGLGLGLALVRGLVELHGGRVLASSEGPGKGTEVVVQLPRASTAPAATVTNGSARLNDCRRRILIIEDNVDSGESLRLALSLAGHQVCLALDGPTGLEAAQKYRPDAVICDIGLPGGMDGYAVARKLRQDGDLPPMTLIAATGYGQERDQQLCREAGYDAHFTKPMDLLALEQLLASASIPTNGT